MKNISKKQIIFFVIAVIVVIAGISVFFAISMTGKKDTVEISLPSAISDEKFVLAEVSKKELTYYYITGDDEENWETFDVVQPKNESAFLDKFVYGSESFLYEETGESDISKDGLFHKWLLFGNNEYYLMDKNPSDQLQLYRLYLDENSGDISHNMYPWPGQDLLPNENCLSYGYDEFSNFGGCISIQSFSDLAEFYSRFTNDICQINYEEQTILVKGVNTETKEISEGFLLEITATEEGFSAKKI